MPEPGKLYVVPTPIGNMGDISPRAVETLRGADFVAAEDTRVGGKLLLLLGIQKPLLSYQRHNEKTRMGPIAERILAGETCALITDAGTPAVSDPGTELVAYCAQRGIEITALPGPCAAVCALSASGLPAARFCFEGFLPEQASKRLERLRTLATEERTQIYYIAPHDLERTLDAILAQFGDRPCVLAKELTKLHETYFRTRLRALCEEVAGMPPPSRKGEFVLIVQGCPQEDAFWSGLTPSEHVAYYTALGLSTMDACKQAARDRGISKSAVYSALNHPDRQKGTPDP